MPVVIDPQSGLAHDLPSDQAQAALASGFHVPLNDPNGNPVSADYQTALDLVKQGHTQPTAPQLKSLLKQTQYGTTPQQVLTGLEGAGETVAPILFNKAETALGLTTPEDIVSREEVNPGSHAVGSVAGGIGGLLAAPEASGPGLIAKAGALAKGIGGKGLLGAAARVGTAGAIEGALYGASHGVNEAALGNPAYNAEAITHEIGTSAIMGAPLALAFAPIAHGAEKLLKARAAADAIKMGDIGTGAGVEVPSNESPEFNQLKTSLENAAPEIKPEGTVDYRRGTEINQVLHDNPYPLQPIQLNSMKDDAIRLRYKMMSEANDETGEALRALNQTQKNWAINDLQNTAQSLAPGKELTSDELQSGRQFIDSLKEQYNSEKAALKPGWEKFENVSANPLSSKEDFLNLMNRAVPGSIDHLETLENGQIALPQYRKGLNWTPEAHSAMNDVLDELNKPGGTTLGEIKNISENIRNEISIGNGAKANAQLRNIYKELRDYVVENVPDQDFKGQLTRYAQNENLRSTFESILHGDIGEYLEHNNKIIPENVMNNLFKNSNAVNAAKELLGTGKFNEMTGNYLMNQIEKATKDTAGGFYSSKFGSFLDKKDVVLREALAENPQTIERIKAANDLIKLTKDVPPANPSHTADVSNILMERAARIRSLLNPMSWPGEVIGGAYESIQNAANTARRDALMRGLDMKAAEEEIQKKVVTYGLMKNIADKSEKLTNKILKGSAAIFKGGQVTAGLVGHAAKDLIYTPQRDASEPIKMDKISTMVQNAVANPEGLMDHISTNAAPLMNNLPDHGVALSSHIGNIVNFLASKIPQGEKAAPLDAEIKPSNAAIQTFNRYASIVQDPLSILSHLKNGTILPQDIETLSTVNPEIYSKTKEALMDNLTNYMSKKNAAPIPMPVKMGLSMFLGQDLDSSLTPTAIHSNQMVLAGAQAQEAAKQAGQQKTRVSKGGIGKMNIEPDQTSAQIALSRKTNK